ncbi:hypothetical protein AB0G73_24250 [Streptomyces sp. NPDC020719]|uniref:hypothetical protein n=1 Tax=Streptomyces sp. NPDC020719 TaxID=3154896 RepID=UPI0033E75399
MGRHRLHVDSDVVAALTWWAWIFAGLTLLGVSAQQDVDRDLTSDGLVASFPDAAPTAHTNDAP